MRNASVRPGRDLRRRKWRGTEATIFAALCAALLSPGTATAGLPKWTGHALRGDERVARFDTCGADCFLVYTCTAADTLAGRLVRTSRRRGMIAYSEQYVWLGSDLACPGEVVRVKNAIPVADARAVLEYLQSGDRA